VWKLKAKGRTCHSSLPHEAVNSLELAMEAVAYIQKRFYQDFPPVSYSCFNLIIFDHSSDIGKSDVIHFLIE